MSCSVRYRIVTLVDNACFFAGRWCSNYEMAQPIHAIANCERQLLVLVTTLKSALEACEDTTGHEPPPVTLEQARFSDGDRLRMEAYMESERVRLDTSVQGVKSAFASLHGALGQLTDWSEEQLLAKIAELEAVEAQLDERFISAYLKACDVSDDIDKNLNEIALRAFR